MSTVSRVAQRPAGRDNTPPLRERDVEFLQARAIDPAALPLLVDNLPAELLSHPQFVAWDYEVREGKPTKVPRNPHTGRKAQSNNPKTWGTLADALACMSERILPGVGFMFSPDDPYTGIDLDKCRDPETGAIANWARSIILQLDSYTEVSPSGTGVKIIVQGTKPGPRCKTTKPNTIEMYDAVRFFTLTGHHLDNTPTTIEARQDELSTVYDAIFPAKTIVTRTPASPSAMNIDDRDVIDWLVRDQKRRALWEGDTTDHQDDHSAADLALMNYLRYGTGADPAQMDRLFRQSGLYRPERWDKPARTGETYGAGTVRVALPGDTRTAPTARTIPAERVPSPMQAAALETAGADATCIVELARIAELEQQLATMTAERDELRIRLARSDELQRLTMKVLRNPNLKGEKVTGLTVLFTYAAAESQSTDNEQWVDPLDDDGFLTIRRNAIAEQAGCKPDAVSRHIRRLEDAGLIHKSVTRKWEDERVTHDGEILKAGYYSTMRVKPSADTREVMRKLASVERQDGKTWGGEREKRVTCPDHPDAAVNIYRIEECAECASELDRTLIDRIAPDLKRDLAVSEKPPATVVTTKGAKMLFQESDTCGLCRRPLRNDDEHAEGCHSYDCLSELDELHRPWQPLSTTQVPAWGGND
jgi:predicted transcriptional regulator